MQLLAVLHYATHVYMTVTAVFPRGFTSFLMFGVTDFPLYTCQVPDLLELVVQVFPLTSSV